MITAQDAIDDLYRVAVAQQKSTSTRSRHEPQPRTA